MRNFVLLMVAASLAACSSVTVPDMTYFRLPEPGNVDSSTLRQVTLPIDVEVFAADGLYAEQSIIYAIDADARALRGYHYQLWSDPPSRMLQRRLIGLLRRAQSGAQVTDRLPASADALRIDGVILRYDRIQKDGGFAAEVSMQLRVEHAGQIVLERVYSAEQKAENADIASTVQAFGGAVDRIFVEFLAALSELPLGAKP
ncbi:MAG: ABC-type transport auxiliary lipoprotein family protein [Tahibacter sp.]